MTPLLKKGLPLSQESNIKYKKQNKMLLKEQKKFLQLFLHRIGSCGACNHDECRSRHTDDEVCTCKIFFVHLCQS